jgi:outer membrane protein TolC
MKRLILALPIALLFVPLIGHALSLEEGLKVVTRNGRDVMIARSDESAAREAVALARAPWLPFVDLYGREMWLRYQPEAKFGGTVVPTSQDQFTTYGVRATQMLYDFGKTSSSIDAAKFGLKAREIDTLRVRNRAALDFIIAYLDLLEAEKLLQVAEDEVKQYEAHKKDAEARYNAGVVTRNEVLQADVTLSDSRQRHLTADNLRSLRASKLNSLLMRPLNEAVQTEEFTKTPSAGITIEEAWTVADAESPELKEVEAGIQAREAGLQSVKAEFLPNVFLSGGYEYQENQYLVYQRNWSLIAGVNINLFSGGASSARTSIARRELDSLKAGRDKLTDAMRLGVKAAYLDLQSSAQKIEVTKTAVEQADENLRLQRLRYQEGVGTSLEVLDAVNLLSAAQTNTWKARYGFERAEANLLHAMGRDLASVYVK